jgi:hypothetical protein
MCAAHHLTVVDQQRTTLLLALCYADHLLAAPQHLLLCAQPPLHSPSPLPLTMLPVQPQLPLPLFLQKLPRYAATLGR